MLLLLIEFLVKKRVILVHSHGRWMKDESRSNADRQVAAKCQRCCKEEERCNDECCVVLKASGSVLCKREKIVCTAVFE